MPAPSKRTQRDGSCLDERRGGAERGGVTKVKLYTEFNWKGYCRSVSHGTSTLARSARLCLLLDGNTPSKMRGDCERQMASGAMLQESYGVNMDAIDRVEEGFNRGEQTHQVATPFGDWQDLGGGGHMRRSHIRHRW